MDPVDPASDAPAASGQITVRGIAVLATVAPGITVGGELTCRMPAVAVADVPDVYACPGKTSDGSNAYNSSGPTPYNTICVRLGDLPQIEIDEGAASSLVLLILGAVFIPCGLSLAIISVLCAFKALKQYKARSAPPKMAGGVA